MNTGVSYYKTVIWPETLRHSRAIVLQQHGEDSCVRYNNTSDWYRSTICRTDATTPTLKPYMRLPPPGKLAQDNTA
jgi:hypothetical protein